MSFKDFSTAQNTNSTDKPVQKPKVAPLEDQPTATFDKPSAAEAPATKP